MCTRRKSNQNCTSNRQSRISKEGVIQHSPRVLSSLLLLRKRPERSAMCTRRKSNQNCTSNRQSRLKDRLCFRRAQPLNAFV
ncbi:hypothetical protein V1478_006858 [Vespula squamosa]|uniref:Uncharacterized protein n=1 Tax=Vespula squamosa TaxID=30214 RepID=A0ABD2B1I4_VESSQ